MIKEIIRGPKAYDLIKAQTSYYSNSDNNKEYLIARISFQLLDYTYQYDLSFVKFNLISEKGNQYSYNHIGRPEPTIDAKLFEGATHEGYLTYLVDKTDLKPTIVFEKDYRGENGAWFKAYTE
jgi:hypothetical protein